ncbi:MAG: hypothetical protein PHY02_00880 [Phycisphaerae bacterium]|nr:hypothetical protein [Phycisphaerae bacterium]
MGKTIFLVALACLLAGCSGKGPTAMKLKTETNVTSEQGLSVRVMAHDEKPLPIRMVPDEIVIGAFVASSIAAVATVAAAIVAAITACFAKKSAKAAAESAKETKLSAEGQLFLVLVKEGFSENMQDDVIKIEEYIPELEKMEKNREATENRLGMKPSVDDAMTDAYRNVSHYLLNALSLYRLGYISKNCFKSVCEPVVYSAGIIEILKYFGEGYYFCSDRFRYDNNVNPERVDEKVAKLCKDFDEIKNIMYE